MAEGQKGRLRRPGCAVCPLAALGLWLQCVTRPAAPCVPLPGLCQGIQSRLYLSSSKSLSSATSVLP